MIYDLQGVRINSSINSLLIVEEANGLAVTDLYQASIPRPSDMRIHNKSTCGKFYKGPRSICSRSRGPLSGHLRSIFIKDS